MKAAEGQCRKPFQAEGQDWASPVVQTRMTRRAKKTNNKRVTSLKYELS
jgi:hypothetical protein